MFSIISFHHLGDWKSQIRWILFIQCQTVQSFEYMYVKSGYFLITNESYNHKARGTSRKGVWGHAIAKVLKTWCSKIPLVVFWEDNFCLKCSAKYKLRCLCKSIIRIHLKITEQMLKWGSFLSWSHTGQVLGFSKKIGRISMRLGWLDSLQGFWLVHHETITSVIYCLQAFRQKCVYEVIIKWQAIYSFQGSSFLSGSRA